MTKFVCDAIDRGYNLVKLAEGASASKRKRRVILRAIVPTQVTEQDLYRIVVQPVNVWVGAIRDHILPAYDTLMSTLVKDAGEDDLRNSLVIAQTQALTVASSVSIQTQVRGWLGRTVAWHTQKWVDAVKSGTGVDVFPFINIAANRPQIEAMFERITGLITSVSDQVRKDVADTIWAGVLNQTSRREMGKQLSEKLGIARRRANFIASDQAHKVSGVLTEIRQTEAGIDRYQWKGIADGRERPTHVANNDKIFQWGKPPMTGPPSYEPRCRCSALAVLDLFSDDNGA